MAVVSTGMQQWELDELCCSVASGDEAAPSSPNDALLKDAKKTQKKRRITFSALGTEISELSVGEAGGSDDRAGLAQSTLDELAVVESTLFERDESPECSELRRKKRSRLSAGGAGTKEMFARAAEIVVDTQEAVEESSIRAHCGKLPQRNFENAENDRNVSNSPSRRSRKIKGAIGWPKPMPLSPGSPLRSAGRRTSGAIMSPLR